MSLKHSSKGHHEGRRTSRRTGTKDGREGRARRTSRGAKREGRPARFFSRSARRPREPRNDLCHMEELNFHLVSSTPPVMQASRRQPWTEPRDPKHTRRRYYASSTEPFHRRSSRSSARRPTIFESLPRSRADAGRYSQGNDAKTVASPMLETVPVSAPVSPLLHGAECDLNKVGRVHVYQGALRVHLPTYLGTYPT